MFSQSSRRRTPDAREHLASARTALVDVAENSFFAFVDPVGDAAFQELAVAVPVWMQASVRFDGAFGGWMHVVLAEPLALDLYAAFLGLEPGDTPRDESLFDLVGEFGNMVCGLWLTRACQRRRFDLKHPEVTRLDALPAGPAAGAVLASINGHAARVHLAFSEA